MCVCKHVSEMFCLPPILHYKVHEDTCYFFDSAVYSRIWYGHCLLNEWMSESIKNPGEYGVLNLYGSKQAISCPRSCLKEVKMVFAKT